MTLGCCEMYSECIKRSNAYFVHMATATAAAAPSWQIGGQLHYGLRCGCMILEDTKLLAHLDHIEANKVVRSDMYQPCYCSLTGCH